MILRKCHKRSSYFVCDIFEIELIDLFVLVSAVNTFKGEKKLKKMKKTCKLDGKNGKNAVPKVLKCNLLVFFFLHSTALLNNWINRTSRTTDKSTVSQWSSLYEIDSDVGIFGQCLIAVYNLIRGLITCINCILIFTKFKMKWKLWKKKKIMIIKPNAKI